MISLLISFSFVSAVSTDNGITMKIVSSFIPRFPSWFSSTGILSFDNSLPLICFQFSSEGIQRNNMQSSPPKPSALDLPSQAAVFKPDNPQTPSTVVKAWNDMFLCGSFSISPKHFSNIVVLNPYKTLALGINYLTVINLWSALAFYLDFNNSCFVRCGYMKTRPQEEYANDRKLYYLFAWICEDHFDTYCCPAECLQLPWLGNSCKFCKGIL